MRKRKLNFLGVMLLLGIMVSCVSQKEQVVDMRSLLNEMVDREQLAIYPEGAYQCKQASSYNRESVSPDKPGWFADSDGVYCIRTEENNGKKEWVLMEDEGPGCITKIWAVCFYYGLKNTTGANVNFYLDGAQEPTISTNFFDLVKGHDFVSKPFADSTARAGNIYFPIPYAKSCKITMDQKVFYNIINYRKYKPGTKVKTFTMKDFEELKGLREEIGQILNEKPAAKGEVKKQTKQLKKNEALTYALPEGSAAIKQIEIKLNNTKDIAQSLRSVVLKASFDGEQTIWAPVGDFFNNVGKVRSYNMWERQVKEDGTMVCRWVMPYEHAGEIALENMSDETVDVELSVTTDDWKWTNQSMHFHATWRMDEPRPTFPLYDWNFLSAEGQGVVVGDQWTVLNPRQGWWGEGDEKIYIDEDIEKKFPSHFGTGTEDYYGWAGGVVPTPKDEFAKLFLGNIIVGETRSMGYNVCTRTRVLDAIPFSKQIKFDVEASCGTRQRWHYLQYAQTTFWYAIPGVKHNRKPLPEMASADLPTLKGLQAIVENAKKQTYVVEGALEAEIVPVVNKSKGVHENFAKIPVWGEMSNGELRNLWFEKEGDAVELKITEQFEKSHITMAAAVGRGNGRYKIYVNGQLKTEQDLFSNHEGITNPYIDLGECDPVNNAYIVKFVFSGHHENARAREGKYSLGIDFFMIKNNFLKR
ncbi:DUF2961 domain-containing protein [Puteibacter caeruleilacunae]|nr:DUF2961 domain-containing protein [Puteibacter caeruleilacunae]